MRFVQSPRRVAVVARPDLIRLSGRMCDGPASKLLQIHIPRGRCGIGRLAGAPMSEQVESLQ